MKHAGPRDDWGGEQAGLRPRREDWSGKPCETRWGESCHLLRFLDCPGKAGPADWPEPSRGNHQVVTAHPVLCKGFPRNEPMVITHDPYTGGDLRLGEVSGPGILGQWPTWWLCPWLPVFLTLGSAAGTQGQRAPHPPSREGIVSPGL